MPTPAQILDGLAAIAAGQTTLAIVWHVALAALIIALLAGWRPTKKSGAAALTVPLLSVSLLAWLSGNPFNGAIFLLFAVVLAVLAMRCPATRVDPPAAWALVAGPIMIVFGWAYPHFLAGAPWWRYLVQAPTGLIPCPTLSVMVGLTFLAAGFSSRRFALTLGFLGLFYGAFGAFRLGVTIDVTLLTGSVALMAYAVTSVGRHQERAARKAA